MKHDLFVNTLISIINESPAGNLLAIPGIYEILAEEFNNEILDKLDNSV